MLLLLSPAKSLDFDTPVPELPTTRPVFLDQAETLIGLMREKSPAEVATLMDLSDKLATLNVVRYAAWTRRHAAPRARAALYAFDGDVYDGLSARTLPSGAVAGYAQAHLGILSGLYGLLRPLDRILPYRLEMGTRLANPAGRDLYAFWGDTIASAINARVDALARAGAPRCVVNLASEEYFKAARGSRIAGRVVTVVFQERRAGAWRIVSFNAKRARGAMARWAIAHAAATPEALQGFDADGYAFDAAASDTDTFYFRREAA